MLVMLHLTYALLSHFCSEDFLKHFHSYSGVLSAFADWPAVGAEWRCTAGIGKSSIFSAKAPRESRVAREAANPPTVVFDTYF